MSTPPPVPAQFQKSGLSVTSLVLGIFGFLCFGFLTGIPAIITGHIARSRARRDPEHYGGGGMALAGLILGYGSFVTTLLVLASMLLPALAKAKAKAQSISCVQNLKSIGFAARSYAESHDGSFPESLLTMSNELDNPKILVCPADKAKTKAVDWSGLTAANVSYQYLGSGMKVSLDSRPVPLSVCPVHDNTVFTDGSVEQRTSGRSRGRRSD